MHLGRLSLRIGLFSVVAVALALGLVVPALASTQTGNTYTVTTMSDAGAGSIRDALTQATAHPGPDTIDFAIQNVFVTSVISLASALPHLTSPVTINGVNQPNQRSVELDGQSQVAVGIVDDVGSSNVNGLTLVGFTDAAAILESSKGDTMFNGNYIGSDEFKHATTSNGTGIRILGSSNNQLGGNDVDNSTGNGVELLPNGTRPSNSNTFQEDNIGEVAPNYGTGMLIAGGQKNKVLFSNLNYNRNGGLLIREFFLGRAILHSTGNYIGEDAMVFNTGVGIEVRRSDNNTFDGDRANGNSQQGIWIHGASGDTAAGNQLLGNTVGPVSHVPTGNSVGIQVGPLAMNTNLGPSGNGFGNNVLGNNGDGILIDGATGTTVKASVIGTGDLGVNANAGNGIEISDADGPSTNTTIGGTTKALYNVIVGSGLAGVLVTGPKSTGNHIDGNYIGVMADGTIAAGNGGPGVQFANSASNNVAGFGDANAGQPNTIADNAGAGVEVDSGNNDRVVSNSIHDNGGLGIDLLPLGVTPNDPGDGDTGPNSLQNYPVITSATVTAGKATVSGTLNTTANTPVRVQLFANDNCDPSGNGEGQTYLAYKLLTTDKSGDLSFTFSGIPVTGSGPFAFTATATGPNGSSEFSACQSS
jgi:parallel beta-helix repeat protein